YAVAPAAEGGLIVAAVIGFLTGSMQPHIGEIGGEAGRRPKPRQLINAECRIVPREKIIDFRNMPTRVPQFKAVAMPARQSAQKFGQPACVAAPMRRKLEEHRAKLRPKEVDEGEEPPQSGFRIFQLLHMGQIPAALDRKEKAG